MKTELSKWSLNAKKWREENGCTSQKWKMYTENRKNIMLVMVTISYFTGVGIGILCPY